METAKETRKNWIMLPRNKINETDPYTWLDTWTFRTTSDSRASQTTFLEWVDAICSSLKLQTSLCASRILRIWSVYNDPWITLNSSWLNISVSFFILCCTERKQTKFLSVQELFACCSLHPTLARMHNKKQQQQPTNKNQKTISCYSKHNESSELMNPTITDSALNYEKYIWSPEGLYFSFWSSLWGANVKCTLGTERTL